METRSIVRGVRLSADKGRLVADMIRGKKVDQAINILTFTPKKAAGIIKKCLESAIANAEHNDGADIDEPDVLIQLCGVKILELAQIPKSLRRRL